MVKIFSLCALILGISSCDIVNKLVPDVNTDYAKTFQIQIFTDNGLSDPQLIDVSSSTDYNSFKNNISGFELQKITYLVKNVNCPDDMYFSGTIICSNEENTETYTIGTISQANLVALETPATEKAVSISPENSDKILAWLDSPGRFNAKTSYSIIKLDGTPYPMHGFEGSNFELLVRFYVTVKTKV